MGNTIYILVELDPRFSDEYIAKLGDDSYITVLGDDPPSLKLPASSRLRGTSRKGRQQGSKRLTSMSRLDLTVDMLKCNKKFYLLAEFMPKSKIIILASLVSAILIFSAIIIVIYINNLQAKKESGSEEWEKMTFCEKMIGTKRAVSSQMPVPEFDTLPDEYYTRGVSSAPINFNGSFPEAKSFETKIIEATENGPNFAGHFTVAEWGCGSNCQSHAVLDNETGEIIAYGIPSQYGLKFNIESKILVANPKDNLPLLEKLDTAPIKAAEMFAPIECRYYKIVENEPGGTFSLLHFCSESAGSHYLNQ